MGVLYHIYIFMAILCGDIPSHSLYIGLLYGGFDPSLVSSSSLLSLSGALSDVALDGGDMARQDFFWVSSA